MDMMEKRKSLKRKPVNQDLESPRPIQEKNKWITKKKKNWITKKEKPKSWITRKKGTPVDPTQSNIINKESKFIKRKKYNIGGRANLLEEVGRLDAEKMNPNRRAEKKRVIGELNKGYKGVGMAQRGLGRAFMKGGKA
jgi:hypothetical protein